MNKLIIALINEVQKSISKGDLIEAKEFLHEVFSVDLKSKFKTFVTSLKTKYPKVTLNVFYVPNSNIVDLQTIIVPENLRRRGIGTKVVKELIQWTKANKTIIALTPDPDIGENKISKTNLLKFYKKLGFKNNTGKNKNYQTRNTMIQDFTD